MKRYFSDKSGTRVPEFEVSILRVNKRSPLHEKYPEIHLSLAEAEELSRWLAEKPDQPAKAAKPKAPKASRPSAPDRPQASA